MRETEKAIENLNIAKNILCNQQMLTSEMCIRIGQAITDAISLLKEQEAVEPRRDANCVRMFRCGVCGEYVGFIDSDTGDPNEQDNYCRNCGRKVKWNE